MSNQSKPRLLGLLLVATLVVLVGDLSGHPAAEAIRSAAGTVVGPAQRFLAGVRPAQVAQLSAENAELRAEADRLSRQLHVQSQLEELVGAGVVKGRTAVIGQVVASEVSAVGGRSLTLDVGSHDGVVAVAPWTCDVQLLGAAQSVVAVRVGERGLLGTVAPVPVGGGDDSTQLALTLAQPGNPHVGDRVTTLGSVGGRPYAPGITLGRVVSVDPDRGRDTVTGRVVPAVDRESIDVVAVLIPEARAQPRPVVGDRTGEEPRVG